MRTGVDMDSHAPEELAAALFQQPSARLKAMRQGVFFVVVDEYSTAMLNTAAG